MKIEFFKTKFTRFFSQQMKSIQFLSELFHIPYVDPNLFIIISIEEGEKNLFFFLNSYNTSGLKFISY